MSTQADFDPTGGFREQNPIREQKDRNPYFYTCGYSKCCFVVPTVGREQHYHHFYSVPGVGNSIFPGNRIDSGNRIIEGDLKCGF
jgi:hypothetical protein